MIKRIDFIIDTIYDEEYIMEIIKYELGEILLYKIESMKGKDKEDVIKDMTGL